MLKKLIIAGIVTVCGATLLMGTSLFTYMKMGVAQVQENIHDNIPIDVEIKRARQMITELKPEIAHNLKVIAKEQVEVARLQSEVGDQQLALSKAKRDIMRLTSDLKSNVHFVYAGKSYNKTQVRDDLSSRFKQFQTQESTTTKLEKILSAREKNLDAAQRKLDAMLAAKRELEIEVEGLQADLTLVQVAEASSSLNLNDSHLSQTRELLDDIRSRIDVAQQLTQNEALLDGNINLDEEVPSDLVDQITDYFGEGRAEVETMVQL